MVPSLNRLAQSDEDDERAVEDSLWLDVHYGSDSVTEDSIEDYAVTNSLRQRHKESYGSKEADTAFIDFQDDNVDGPSLIDVATPSSPLPPRLLPPPPPLALLPPIIHPPPRLKSTSPRKRPHPPLINRLIFAPPKRIAPTRSAPSSPQLTSDSQRKSQSISEIMEADDFTTRSPPPAKKQKRELAGKWDGDLISEWELRKELGVGVAFPKDDEYEGEGYIKVYVDAPLRLEIRRRLREWEMLRRDGARIRMRLVNDVGEDIDEEGWR